MFPDVFPLPSPCLYLTDIDPCVFLIIGSVADSQSQLLLAANATQLHLLQRSTQAHAMAFARSGKNYLAQRSTDSILSSHGEGTVLPQYVKSHAYTSRCSWQMAEFCCNCSVSRYIILCATSGEKLRRKFQYMVGSSYTETISKDFPEKYRCELILQFFSLWIIGADLQYIIQSF